MYLCSTIAFTLYSSCPRHSSFSFIVFYHQLPINLSKKWKSPFNDEEIRSCPNKSDIDSPLTTHSHTHTHTEVGGRWLWNPRRANITEARATKMGRRWSTYDLCIPFGEHTGNRGQRTRDPRPVTKPAVF